MFYFRDCRWKRDWLLADKAYDAEERVLVPLEKAGIEAVS